MKAVTPTLQQRIIIITSYCCILERRKGWNITQGTLLQLHIEM